jgi:nicotinate-nucleotide adenylyltransferase
VNSEESPSMTFIDAPLFPLSATEIREMIRKGDDISNLVPSEALSLIWKLYSE